MKLRGINFKNLQNSAYDSLMGYGSGAGVIFGTSGGVMEAALRSAHYFLTGENLKELEFKSVRSLDGFIESEVSVGGKKLKVAVVSGLVNVRKVLADIDKGKHYDFVEVMACLGGCLAGGGQPKNINVTNEEARKKRRQSLPFVFDISFCLFCIDFFTYSFRR